MNRLNVTVASGHEMLEDVVPGYHEKDVHILGHSSAHQMPRRKYKEKIVKNKLAARRPG